MPIGVALLCLGELGQNRDVCAPFSDVALVQLKSRQCTTYGQRGVIKRALAHAAFRELVERVVVYPAPKGEEPRAEILGKLAVLLDLRGLGSPL